ncbi:MAG TPA: BatD family protein, partial [Thermoanaerobaculia bacterium]
MDRPTVRAGESFRVVITLEGTAAEVERLPIPLTNVELVGSPSVSRQYSFINGRFTRTKVLQYTARPLAEGRATVGPIRIEVEGETLEIPGAAVEVLPATAPGDETPAAVLRQMEREQREPVFVTVQADRDRAVVGQQIVVTWTVWARDEITEPTVVDLPALDGFWSEEIPVTEPMTNMVVDGDLLARAVVRRVALFPLRSGELEVGPLQIRAGMFGRSDPFGFGVPFRSGFVNVSRSSPTLTIGVSPVPRDADVVGAFAMRCGEPVARGGGPASLVVTVEGEGNLRLAPAPRFERRPAVEIQVEAGEMEVRRSPRGLHTKRSWTLLAVPGGAAPPVIPPLSLRAWNPESGRMELLRCAGGRARIEQPPAPRAVAPPPPAARPAEGPPSRGVLWPLLLAGALVVGGGTAWFLFARRRGKLRPQEARVLRHADDPRRMKEEVKEMLREKAID